MRTKGTYKYYMGHLVDMGDVKLPYENLVFNPTKEGRNE
jgi:hypothetical protein